MKHVKYGFTLAETLITIGVIGLVAAMTLPSIIAGIEKTVLKNQIKKNYSALSQVVQKVLFEFGDGQGVYANSGFGFREFNNAVLNEFKILQVCEKNALAKGCIAEYKGLNVKDCSGFNETNIYNNATVYILYDGSFMIPYHADWRSLWLVDVNGKKGPNKAGYDLFEVRLDEKLINPGNSKMSRLRYVSNACLNQGNPPPVKGGLDDFKNIDKW